MSFFLTFILYYLGSYSSGYSNQLSSNKAIIQQLQSPPKIAPSKDITVMKIRIIVKRGTRQLYVYREKQALKTFSIAIGKTGWETPLGNYQVIYMKKDPIFKNFKTGKLIIPGADNPLGKRLIAFKTYKKFDLAIHGTNQDKLIGQAVSHGCIRMHNKDVIALYELVNIGTPVTVLP
jgi:lipoprotein-anchoring transpeptidase ErfK/SrfK